MTDRDWDIKCKAAFIGLYGAMKLCQQIGMNPHDMLDMLRDKLAADGCILACGTIIEKPTTPSEGSDE